MIYSSLLPPVSQPSAQDKSNIVHVNHRLISKHQQTANKENKIPISVIVVQVVGCSWVVGNKELGKLSKLEGGGGSAVQWWS